MIGEEELYEALEDYMNDEAVTEEEILEALSDDEAYDYSEYELTEEEAEELEILSNIDEEGEISESFGLNMSDEDETDEEDFIYVSTGDGMDPLQTEGKGIDDPYSQGAPIFRFEDGSFPPYVPSFGN